MKKSILLGKLAALAAGGIASIALAVPAAQAQVGLSIHIGTPPPALRYEAHPPAPGPGFVWADGYWEPSQGRYRWHPGYWNRAPYEGAYFVHPHWDHYPDGWHMHDGYWAHEDHDNHYWDNHHDDRGHN